MKIIANCGCDRWAEVLAKKMFARNNVSCEEACIVGMDYKWITLKAETCGGTAAVFSGTDEQGYQFCLVARQGDLRQLGREMTAALDGRGGGKPVCQQGRVRAKQAEILLFFHK